MSTRKSSKQEATELKDRFDIELKDKPWFIKSDLDSDDHGPLLRMFINKKMMEEMGDKVPFQTEVKICVYNSV